MLSIGGLALILYFPIYFPVISLMREEHQNLSSSICNDTSIIHSVPFWGEDPFKRWHINHMVQIQCAFMNSIGRRQHIMLYILAPSWSISVKSHTLSISCDFSSYFNFISSLIVHRLSSMVFNLIIIFWRHLKSVSYVTVSITTVNFEAFWDSSSAHMYHTFWFISSLVT